MSVNSSILISFARGVSKVASQLGLSGQLLLPAPSRKISLRDRYYAAIRDEELRKHTEARFLSGHYQDSVFEAYKYVNNYIKRRTKITGIDGSKLMELTFTPNNPVLVLNNFTTASEKDEQAGYMKLFAGSMLGIRNPRAHENSFDNDPERALELLNFANHLLNKAKLSKRKRRKKSDN